jgi:hypothetical protein
MRSRTLITDRLYFGLPPTALRGAASRVVGRVVGLSREQARVSADAIRQDFAVDTVMGNALLHEFVDAGLLRPHAERTDNYEVTGKFMEFAMARVVEPLPRARAKLLLAKAAELAAHVNADWGRNPLEIHKVTVSGGYMSKQDGLAELTLGLVVRSRAPTWQARWGRMANKTAGAIKLRTAFAELSSFIVIHLATDVKDLPRPFSVIYDADA